MISFFFYGLQPRDVVEPEADSVATIACRKTVTIWPHDPATLQLSQEETTILENFLNENYEFLKDSKSDFKHHQNYEINGKTWNLPRTVCFLENGAPIVHLKNMEPPGAGCQKEIKNGYNPLTGELVVKKRIQLRSELTIYNHFAKKPQAGIVPILGVRKVTFSDGKVKYQAYEARYSKDLMRCIFEEQLSLKEKVGIARDLI